MSIFTYREGRANYASNFFFPLKFLLEIWLPSSTADLVATDVMGRNRDGSEGTLPCTADQSPPPPPKSSRKRHQGHHSKHSRKKQKFIFPETDTKSLSQSKTVAKITPPNSHKCNRHSHKGRKHRNRKELRSEHSQRKWTYSAHDDSNCVGNARTQILIF